MWRKIDSKKRSLFIVSPSIWEENFYDVAPSDGHRASAVVRKRTCEDIDKNVLNPNEVNLTKLIDSGVSIDPSMVRSMLNISDPADIEVYNRGRESKLYEYLLNNKEQIIEVKNQGVK